jgi:hypothetical protein
MHEPAAVVRGFAAEHAMTAASLIAPLAIAAAGVACASSPVVAEMEACHLPEDARQELRLSEEQDRRIANAYARLEPERKQVDSTRARRRAAGIPPDELDRITKELIAVERRCREQMQPVLTSVLTAEQYEKVLAMEENHQKAIRARRPSQ